MFYEASGEDHSHVIYLNEDKQYGLTAEKDGHVHEVMFVPPSPAQTDPNTGEEIAPASPGGWQIMPGPDGHTHELSAIKKQRKQKKESEEQVIKDCLDLLKEGVEQEKENIRKAELAEEFFKGNQWDEGARGALKSVDRACITFNVLEKYVNELSGHQRQQQTEIYYRPQEEGDQKQADLWNIVVKLVLDNRGYQLEKSKVFDDQVIPGRGGFNLYVDRSQNIEGEIVVERMPWGDFIVGPHEKEDLSDCEYLIKHKMFARAKIEQLWPDKAKKVYRDYQDLSKPIMESNDKHITYRGDQYAQSDNWFPANLSGLEMVSPQKKELRVVEVQRKVYEKTKVAAIPQDDYYQNISQFPDDIQKEIATIQGVTIIPHVKTRIRITRFAGRVVLDDENPADLPVDDFLFAVAYGRKRGNDWWGKVYPCIDAQKVVNWRKSQLVDIGNKIVASAWMYDATTFADKSEEDRFKSNATSPGGTYRLMDVNKPPAQVQSMSFPPDVVSLMQAELEAVAFNMNITPTPPGANTSGSRLLAEQKMKLLGNEFLFDHLAQAEARIGKLLPPMIKKVYSAERIYRIIKNSNSKETVMLGGVPFEQFSFDEIKAMLDESDPTKWDIVVTESAYSPTTRLSTYMLLSDLAKNGTPVPPQALVDVMDLPEAQKQKIQDQFAAQQQMEQEQGNSTADMEIQKTLIAQGVIPPAVQEKYGVPPIPNLPPQESLQQAPNAAFELNQGMDQGGMASEGETSQGSSREVELLQHRLESLSMLKEIISAIQNNQSPVIINNGVNGAGSPTVPAVPVDGGMPIIS